MIQSENYGKSLAETNAKMGELVVKPLVISAIYSQMR